jgi:NAD(P)-dependent dehydrogenase (short-subunit alcohol dehydrogenase family)
MFAEEGASVVIADLDVEGGEAAAEGLRMSGAGALFVETDVTKREDVRRLITSTLETFGHLDIVHNNAYWAVPKACVDVEEWEWDMTIDVVLKGAFLCAKYAIPAMSRTGGGSIINSASTHSIVAFKGFTAYQAAKAGLLGLTRSLAVDYAPAVRVNALVIGAVRSPALEMASPRLKEEIVAGTPLGRFAEPGEIAQAVAYLASDDASFITGSALVIDGGWTIQ